MCTMYTHKQLQNICMRCQSAQVPRNAFARLMPIQKIFLSSFLFINIHQTLNTNSLFVGINTDKQIKHVHSNQEKVILTQIFTSAQNTSGLPQSLHTKSKIKTCDISFLTWAFAGSNPAPNSTSH